MGTLMDRKSGYVPDYYAQKRATENKIGRKISNEEFERDYLVMNGGWKIERHRDINL